MTISTPADERSDHARSVFARVVVGIDGSEPSLVACRQALRLVEPDSWVELVTAVELAVAARTGFSAPRVAAELEREAQAALGAAARIAGPRASSRLVNGSPSHVLLEQTLQEHATLIALGTHGHSRASEILIGGVAGEILHTAACSVLIARSSLPQSTFPTSIVVGVDGSPHSDIALATAEELGRRFDAPLRILVAAGGKQVDLAHIRLRTPYAETVEARPVDALVEASEHADLLIVGSRGLHGLPALGSVSERVAHRAACSVLVVRQPPG